MPTELASGIFWLLLPVAAASGWFIANRKTQKKVPCPESIAPEYLKGLRYIINEQPDKAIEVFVKLLEVDNQTVEVHLALGNIFRRRGEVDRAIKIHQNLMARPTLSYEQRSQALLELGVDYLRSGLFDRAEALFYDLLQSPCKSRAAQYLVEIYQDEKDWEKAIDCARAWQQASKEKQHDRIAHFYCQQAEDLMAADEFISAKEKINRALEEDRNSAHAIILSGRLSMIQGEYNSALHSFMQIEKKAPELLNEVLPLVKICYREMGNDDGFQAYLQKIPGSQICVAQIMELARQIENNEGSDNAMRFLVEKVNQTPSIRILDRLIELSLKSERELGTEKLQCLKRITEKLVDTKFAYKCHHCGYQARSIYWQCPGCKHWDTVKPIQGC